MLSVFKFKHLPFRKDFQYLLNIAFVYVIVHGLERSPCTPTQILCEWSHIVQITRLNEILHVTKNAVGMFSCGGHLFKNCCLFVQKWSSLWASLIKGKYLKYTSLT